MCGCRVGGEESWLPAVVFEDSEQKEGGLQRGWAQGLADSWLAGWVSAQRGGSGRQTGG